MICREYTKVSAKLYRMKTKENKHNGGYLCLHNINKDTYTYCF